MQTFHNILSLTCVAASTFDAYDLVGFDDEAVDSDDAPVKGVALNPATEIGLPVALMAIGMVRVKAVGVITAGTKVISAAAGGVKAAVAADPEADPVVAGSANAFATALTDAADGEFLDILIR